MSHCPPLSAYRTERVQNETPRDKVRRMISGYLGEVHHRLILVMDQKRDAHTFGASDAVINAFDDEEHRLHTFQDVCREILASTSSAYIV